MSNYRAVAVELPHLTPVVWVSPELAPTLELIKGAGAIGISSFKLMDADIYDFEINVAQLQKEGAVIFIDRRPDACPGGILWDDILHYIYRGWIQNLGPIRGTRLRKERN
jgi:hypothetical protein